MSIDSDLGNGLTLYSQLNSLQKRAVEWKAAEAVNKGTFGQLGSSMEEIRAAITRDSNMDGLVKAFQCNEKENTRKSFIVLNQDYFGD